MLRLNELVEFVVEASAETELGGKLLLIGADLGCAGGAHEEY